MTCEDKLTITYQMYLLNRPGNFLYCAVPFYSWFENELYFEYIAKPQVFIGNI